MDTDAFEAHLALHGLVRYDHATRNLGGDHVVQAYVDDAQLIELFRDPGFTRIDQYGEWSLRFAAQRQIPGFEEFGSIGPYALYTLKKNHG